MKINSKVAIACILAVLASCIAALVVSSSESDNLMVYVKTDKTEYLMDPYYWVYSAADFKWWFPAEDPDLWPEGGYSRTVNFDVYVYDASGNPVEYSALNYDLYDGEILLKSGQVAPQGDGVYSGSFELVESDIGGEYYTGQETKILTLVLSTESEEIKEHKIYVGRWGCDKCHLDQGIATEVYPWCEPTGGIGGPHNWPNILGRNFGSGFDITYLTDAEKTHTPENCLNVTPFHEKTIRKWSGDPKCSPCHQGSGHVRYNFSQPGEYPWLAHAKSEAVECTFCHGGGNSLWADNSGYIISGHGHNGVPLPPDTPRDPYLARQTCSNPGCHGHITDDEQGEIDNAKPDCRLCHGIHN